MSGKHRAEGYKGQHRPSKQNIHPRFTWALPAVAGIALLTAVLSNKAAETKVTPDMPTANRCSIVSVHDVPYHVKQGNQVLDQIDAGLTMNRETAKSLGNRAVSVTLKHIGEEPHKTQSSFYVDRGLPTASILMPPNQPEGTEAVVTIRPSQSETITCDTRLVLEGGEWHRMTQGDMPLRSAEQQPTHHPRRG